MIVHFIASKGNLPEEIENFRLIRSTILDLGHELARDWIEEEHAFIQSGKHHTTIDWKAVNQENMEAIARADLVIAEASTKSFSIGFQVASAVQQKKPVLILTHNDALGGSFGSGIAPDFVVSKVYSADTIRTIVTDFLVENEVDSKDLRFNFFIDRKIHNYLRWASYKTGKNKSEILRNLILREIDRED